MKTLAEDLNNIAVLNENEMMMIKGGDGYIASTTTEDEDAWL